MRIAYLASGFPSHTTTFILNEVVAHHRAGVDLLVLSCDSRMESKPLSVEGQVWSERTARPRGILHRLCSVLTETARHPVLMLRNFLWLVGLLFVDPVEFLKAVRELSTASCLARACRAHRTQLIHVHFASRSLSAGLMLGRLVDCPVSCTVHAFELWGRSGRNLRYRLGRCCFIAAISRYNVEYLRRKCGEAVANLCDVVHCGVDLSRFDFGARSPVPGRIVLISQLTEKKGHRYLVEACAILKRRGIAHECILVGTGAEAERIRQQIQRLGLIDVVKLAGPVANDRLQPFLKEAAVFALPAIVDSRGDQDGIPVALMEAMACGVPVVSTTVSGIPELLRQGQAGYIVPPEDSESLADALSRMLQDGELAARLSRAGVQAVQDEFDISKTTAQLRALFEYAIAAATGRRVPSAGVPSQRL